MITVRNDYFGMLLISHEEKRRELAAVSDLFQALFYMGIADSEQRQCRCSKDVFGLEAVHLSAFQLLDKPRGGFLVIEQVQVSLSRGIVMLFRFGQPLDLDLLAHGLTSPLWIDQRRHQWDQYPT